MKLSVASIATLCLAPSTAAFSAGPTTFIRTSTRLMVGNDPNVQIGGNTWQPDSGKMGSTDTGDFFPDDYEPGVDFGDGMMGSQMGNNRDRGPQLPGMENLGEDAVMMGGIEANTDIPAGMEFIPSSVPDGLVEMNVAASGSGETFHLAVKPVCMTFENYFVAFAPGAHPSLSVTPQTGRMDRRGGEITELLIKCTPKGKAGTFEGDLVINLPEDNSKICYKVVATSF